MHKVSLRAPEHRNGQLTIEPGKELLGAVVGVNDDGAIEESSESVCKSQSFLCGMQSVAK